MNSQLVRFQLGIWLLTLGLPGVSLGFDILHPDGTENLGYLVVNLPHWTEAEAKKIGNQKLFFDGRQIEPGKPARFRAGTKPLTYSSQGRLVTFEGIQITKRETTTVNLPGAVVHWDATILRRVQTVDLGGNSSFVTSPTDWPFPADQPLVVNAKHWTLKFPLLQAGEVSFDTRPGEIARVTVPMPPDTSGKLIVDFAPSEYPTALGASLGGPRPVFLIQNRMSESGTPEPRGDFSKVAHQFNPGRNFVEALATDPGPAGGKIALRVQPLSDDTSFFQIAASGTTQRFSVESGEVTSLKVKRLDVDDVLVERENGEKYYARGSYLVYRWEESSNDWKPLLMQNGSQSPSLFELSTKTGLYVLPGKYKVVVSYNTEEKNGNVTEMIADLTQ